MVYVDTEVFSYCHSEPYSQISCGGAILQLLCEFKSKSIFALLHYLQIKLVTDCKEIWLNKQTMLKLETGKKCC